MEVLTESINRLTWVITIATTAGVLLTALNIMRCRSDQLISVGILGVPELFRFPKCFTFLGCPVRQLRSRLDAAAEGNLLWDTLQRSSSLEGAHA